MVRRWEFLQFVGLGYPIFECLLKALDHLSKVGTLQEGRHTCTYLSKTKTKPTQNTCFVRVGRKKTLTGWALSNSSQNIFFIITQRILKKSDVLVAVLQSVRAFLSTRSMWPMWRPFYWLRCSWGFWRPLPQMKKPKYIARVSNIRSGTFLVQKCEWPNIQSGLEGVIST